MENKITYYVNNIKRLPEEANHVAEIPNGENLFWDKQSKESMERNGYCIDSWGIVWSQASKLEGSNNDSTN